MGYYTQVNGTQVVVRTANGQVHMYVTVPSNSSHYVSGDMLVVESNNNTTIWDLNKRQKVRG